MKISLPRLPNARSGPTAGAPSRRVAGAAHRGFSAWRARTVLIFLGLAFGGLIGRAVYLQTVHDSFLQKKAARAYNRVWTVPASRGQIFDRNDQPLAVSTPARSVWALARTEEPSVRELEAVAQIVGVPARELRRKLTETDRDRVLLNRWVPLAQAERLAALKLPWVVQELAYRRSYPTGESMAHVLGFTDVDGKGIEGVELALESTLAGSFGSRKVVVDAKQRVVREPQSLREARDGDDVRLTLDARIQHLAYRALRSAMTEHRALGAGLVAIDVTTGEVLALVNLPSYDPNDRKRGTPPPQLSRNRVVADTFEPGSTLKPFTVAAALERGKVTPNTVIQTAPGWMVVNGARIRDLHPAGALTVAEVIQRSSNVGSAKIALEHLDPQDMWQMFDRVGFGAAPRLGLSGEAVGRVRPYKSWKPIEQATMAYGHGISVSLVQLARAYTVFARDGDIVPLALTKRDATAPAPIATRVIAPGTAREIRKMLEQAVVGKGGTGARAQVSGYRVAGKTGSAHKIVNGVYVPEKVVSSFVGFAPASNPRVVIAVMIDEPRVERRTGGVVAAPVFAEVMAGILQTLRVPTDAPHEPVRLPSANDDPQEGM